ncbi:hypothetical protein HZ326_21920 [Fusarium oxysporum f. sp. albedinis]|nr:hypothetical protein HZ326_21920 [Fusarium oxysporum f. sp. albedinis]
MHVNWGICFISNYLRLSRSKSRIFVSLFPSTTVTSPWYWLPAPTFKTLKMKVDPEEVELEYINFRHFTSERFLISSFCHEPLFCRREFSTIVSSIHKQKRTNFSILQ